MRKLEQAAAAGNGPAAKKLMEIYGSGGWGVSKDYGKSVQWKNRAKALGQDVNE